MIVCRKCSRRHPDGTEFCVCGAYLEFDGEHVSDPSGPGAVQSTVGTAGSSGSLPPPPPAARESEASRWATEPAPRAAAGAAEPAPWSGFDATPPAPVAAGGGIDAVLPDAPDRVAPTEPIWVDGGARAGDIACRQCGTPNGPERFFCRHCGVSLTGAVDAATTPRPRRVPWWKRLFRRAKTQAGTVDGTTALHRAQGLARGGLSSRTLLFRTGGVVLLLGGLLAFLGPWRGTVTGKVREYLGGNRHPAIDVSADEVTSPPTDPTGAPVAFEFQGAENVVDRKSNTAWATQWLPAGSGFEELPEDGAECQPAPMTDTELVFDFEDPPDVARLEILAGRPDDPRTQYLRPRVLELQVDDEQCTYVALEDTGELAPVAFEHDDIERLVVRIVGVYDEDAVNQTVEISEIVFEK